MIIVKTKNGDRFINDKAVIMVEHLRDKAVVNAYGDKGLYYIVEDVEGVIYTNDAQPTSWRDEGSVLAKQDKELSEARKHNSDLRAHCMELENEKNELNNQIRDLKEEIRKLTPKPEETPAFYNDKVAATIYQEMERREKSEVKRQKIEHPGRYQYQKSGNAKRFLNACELHNIFTVGALLEVGRVNFGKYANIGPLCLIDIDMALVNLYAITAW